MDLGLQGKTALITGGSKGIGRACGEALGVEGCTVAIVARDPDGLQAASEHIRAAAQCTVHAIAADLSSLNGIQAMVAEAHRRLGRIDILVNNAGSIRAGAFLTTPDEQWIEDWNLKLLGYIRAARAVFPLMSAQGGGRIVNLIGAASRQAVPHYLAGGAANAALVNFTKGLSDLGAKDGIFVKAASPGAVLTERWENRVRDTAKAE